jgi:hypothetical protein
MLVLLEQQTFLSFVRMYDKSMYKCIGSEQVPQSEAL